MTSREFCYWLQGYFEIKDAHRKAVPELPGLDGEQVEMIRRHLSLVFKHEIDPSYPKDQQSDLFKIHTPNVPGQLDSNTLVRC